MRNLLNFILSLTFLSFSAVAWGGLPLASYQGNWENENASTRGIVNVNITVSGSSVQIQTFGACSPSPCDWGKQSGTAYASNVSTNVVTSTEKILVVYNQGFAQTNLLIEPYSSGKIRVTAFTRFTDNSGRSNYTHSEIFRKVPDILPAPVAISPACGSVFDNYPRKTTLTWKNVPGASSYTVEIDCFGCCESGKWCTDVGRTFKIVPKVTGTSYTFDFVGAQPGRWRVWAVAANGKPGNKSPWCEFRYTR